MYLYTDQRPGEPDILTVIADHSLVIKDCDNRCIAVEPAPPGGWSHTELCNMVESFYRASILRHGDHYEAYLGSTPIGSTEC